MFYHRCSLIKQINTTISEQDATTDSLLTNAISSSVIDLILLCICCMQAVIDLCVQVAFWQLLINMMMMMMMMMAYATLRCHISNSWAVAKYRCRILKDAVTLYAMTVSLNQDVGVSQQHALYISCATAFWRVESATWRRQNSGSYWPPSLPIQMLLVVWDLSVICSTLRSFCFISLCSRLLSNPTKLHL